MLVLYVSDTPINHDVYLEDYNVTYSGGNGDYDYDISFVVAKPLIVKTEDTTQKETSTGVAKEQDRAQVKRGSKDICGQDR